MEVDRIPLHTMNLKSVPDVRLSGYAPKLVDVIVDENGLVHKRPGLDEFSTLTNVSVGVKWLKWWETHGNLVALSGDSGQDNVFVVEYDGTDNSVDDAGNDTAYPATFAEWSSSAFYLSKGTDIYALTTGPYALAALADADIPAAVGTITAMDQYLLCGNNGDQMHWSDVGAPTSFSGNYLTAESSTDYLSLISAQAQRIYGFGTNSIEIYYDDGVTPFTRVPQGIISFGIQHPKSLVWVPDHKTFYGLRYQDIPFRIQGLEMVDFSPALTKRLSFLTAPGVCPMKYANIDGRPYVIFQPSSDTETIVYDLNTKLYYEWYKWNSGTSAYVAFLCQSFEVPKYSSGAVRALAGATTGNQIFQISSAFKDDDGIAIRSLIRTIAIDHNEPEIRKTCHKLKLHIKRTADVASGNPTSMSISVRYRDNGSKTWTTARTVTLYSTGVANDTDFVGMTSMLGSYKIRQWEFVVSDSVPCCIMEPIEYYNYTE